MVRAAGAFSGLTVLSSTTFAIAEIAQGHSVDYCSFCIRPVATQLWTRRVRYYPPTAEDPGAPFECLGLDLAPGHNPEWKYRI